MTAPTPGWQRFLASLLLSTNETRMKLVDRGGWSTFTAAANFSNVKGLLLGTAFQRGSCIAAISTRSSFRCIIWLWMYWPCICITRSTGMLGSGTVGSISMMTVLLYAGLAIMNPAAAKATAQT